MIKLIKDTVLTSDFIFILILLGFILVVTLLLLENRRDNIRLKQINQKVKDLIAGDYSQVLDMQGSSEITNITNNLNDLSEVIRLTQENLEQESKRLHSILSYMTDGVLATNRRGKITMINDMAKKQLGVQKEDVLNKSILELLKIEDEYELRDLITQIPELIIDSQDANGVYVLPWYVVSLALFLVWLLFCMIRRSRRRKNASVDSLFPTLVMNYGRL